METAFLTPLAAIAATTSGSANSTPVRYQAYLSPLANGGVVANTALSTGGVPTGGDELVGLDSDGAVDWTMPYQDNDIIRPAPISDASGDVYSVTNPADLSPAELVAARRFVGPSCSTGVLMHSLRSGLTGSCTYSLATP